MEIMLSRLRSKKVVHLFLEKDQLRVKVTVSGVKGTLTGKIKLDVPERPLTWDEVLKALNVDVAFNERYPWHLGL